MICCEAYRKKLETYLDTYGIVLSHEQQQLLLKHLDLVVEKNKVMNLTRIIEPEDGVIRHVIDSLLLLPTIDTLCGAREFHFVDVGTGAGFPGIPIGVARSCHGLLIDSVGKKVKAVTDFIDYLGLSDRLQARAIRAEDLARERPGQFDLVIARAVAELAVLLEYASPLLHDGGYLVASKANVGDDELRLGMKTAELVGMTNVSRETCELPNGSGHREIYTFCKDHESPVNLPRRNGDAKNRPLVNL